MIFESDLEMLGAFGLLCRLLRAPPYSSMG